MLTTIPTIIISSARFAFLNQLKQNYDIIVFAMLTNTTIFKSVIERPSFLLKIQKNH